MRTPWSTGSPARRSTRRPARQQADTRLDAVMDKPLAVPVAADGDVHLDLGALTFADVAVARLLARTAARLVPGRKLVLHRPPEALQRLVQMCWPDQPGLAVTDA